MCVSVCGCVGVWVCGWVGGCEEVSLVPMCSCAYVKLDVIVCEQVCAVADLLEI